MKIPGNLLESIPAALVEIFQQNKPADKVVDYYLKNHKKWGSRDRRYFAEKVYFVVRNYRKLWVQAGLTPHHYLNPDRVNLSSMQKVLDAHLKPENLTEISSFAEEESYTDWFDSFGRKELGSEWESVAQALNKQAPVFLRTNTIRTSREKLKAQLDAEEVSCRIRPENETAIELTERKNVFILKSFLQGHYEVQDLSSQFVAPLVSPQPGEKIVDGCAGAGGKTLHLAAMMKNKGQIIAMDVFERKLKELRKRSNRAGCSIVETKLIDSKVIKSLEGTADAVLLDVPCSGSGVIKRNPDTKWKLHSSDMDRLLILQQEILQNYSKMVKKGGRLVYATCSVFPSENIQQVMTFLKQNSDFSLVNSRLFRPDIDPGDGFFMALMGRNK